MNLYLVEIGEDHFNYEPISTTSHLQVLNKLLKQKGQFPILNSNDHRLIRECGGSVVLHGKVVDGKKLRIWLVDLDYVKTESYLGSVEFAEQIGHIISTIKRDLKLEIIENL